MNATRPRVRTLLSGEYLSAMPRKSSSGRSSERAVFLGFTSTTMKAELLPAGPRPSRAKSSRYMGFHAFRSGFGLVPVLSRLAGRGLLWRPSVVLGLVNVLPRVLVVVRICGMGILPMEPHERDVHGRDARATFSGTGILPMVPVAHSGGTPEPRCVHLNRCGAHRVHDLGRSFPEFSPDKRQVTHRYSKHWAASIGFSFTLRKPEQETATCSQGDTRQGASR